MNIVIIGGGGHAGSVITAIGGAAKVDSIVDHHFPEGSMRHGCVVTQHPDHIGERRCFVAIGDANIREHWSRKDFKFINIAHGSSSVYHPPDTIGTFFGANSYVGPNTKVGKFCIINTGAILEHDSELGDFSHLCPGVITGGRVKIGHHTTIGLGAMIRDGVTIGNHCVIGMGAVVTKDVPDFTTAWGNPARHVRGIKQS